MTAEQVKNALYARHFASSEQMPGAWTCIEEWRNIDLLAFSAWQSKGNYARVGYEVKVSRSDLRGELLNPHKRSNNVSWCNEFYLAVPAGLLKPEEIAYVEPEWQPGDFLRAPCPARDDGDWSSDPGPCRKGKRTGILIGPLTKWQGTYRPRVEYLCATCSGRGWIEKSRVEQEAPTLWVPRDVGLVVVDGRGTHLLKQAPRRREVPQMTNAELGQFARFVSMRPDPRHAPRRDAHIAYRERSEVAA